MKRICLLNALLCLLVGLQAQNHQYRIADTAAEVVNHHLRLTNSNALPSDSMLVCQTRIYTPGQTDTLLMMRWFSATGAMRMEQYAGGKMVLGFYTDRDKRYRRYVNQMEWWDDMPPASFNNICRGFNYICPLEGWQQNGTTLTYNGTTLLKGDTVRVVIANRDDYLTRYYLFEQHSGLLVALRETDHNAEGTHMHSPTHIDWKIVHEYIQVGRMLLPSQESIVRHGELTVLETTYNITAYNSQYFDRDRWKTTTSDL